jgi:threonine synthase
MKHALECIECGTSHPLNERAYVCVRCGGLLEIKLVDTSGFDPERWSTRPLGVWRYRELLPIEQEAEVVSLGEGGTGLHECRRLASDIGLKHLHVKNEGENPTGSFKDRGMTVGVTKGVGLSASSVMCASTGNTSASLAAYAARAGLRCFVVIPAGKIAAGKLAQAVVHGAKIIEIDGNFDDAMRLVVDIAKKDGSPYLLNSVNPFRVEGQKTVAFEINEQLLQLPDIIVLPVGNAGNITALWKGLLELKSLGLADTLPRLVGIQAEKASPIADAFKSGSDHIDPVANPETVATAIRIGSPVNWKRALTAARDSGGFIETATDREILEAQKALAGREGIFVEPASASTIAGVRKLVDEGVIKADEEVVCIATGHGLKDQESVTAVARPPTKVKPTQETIMEVLGLSPQLLCRGSTALPEELLDSVRDVGLVEHSDDPLNEVPLRDETDKATLLDDRQSANLLCQHGVEGLPDGRSRRYCDQRATHQPSYWRVVDPLSLRGAQRPARHVAFRDDSDGLSALHDDEASNVPFNHRLKSLLYGGVGFDRYRGLSHYCANGILGARNSHVPSLAQRFIIYALKIHRTRLDTRTSVGSAYCLG